MPLRLSPADYPNLLEVAHAAHDPRQLHRAQAFLWLHAGDTVDEVATRGCVTSRTVFRWRRRWHERQALEVRARRAEEPRSGRPTTVAGMSDALLREVIDDDPRHLGSHSTVWTAPG
jgi:transposase